MTIHSDRPQATDREQLMWSSRIEVKPLGAAVPDDGTGAGTVKEQRPRTSRIEREIIWAVIVLYAAIIACFAGLHLLGAAQFG